MFKRLYIAGALVATLLCAGCAGTALGTVYTNLTTITPTVANSAKTANDLFTFMASGADTYVRTAHPSADTVRAIEGYRVALKAELDKINADMAAEKSPVFDVFNDALTKWRAYNTQNGIGT